MADNSTPRSLAGMEPHSALSSNLPHSETRSLSKPVTHAASEDSKEALRGFEVKCADGPPIMATSTTSSLDGPGSSRHQQLLQRVDLVLLPTDASPTPSSQPNNGRASDTEWELVNGPGPSMDTIEALVETEKIPSKMNRYFREGHWTSQDYHKGEEERSL